MSRTIRRKGFNRRTSAKRFEQYNNPYAYMCEDRVRWMYIRGENFHDRLVENQRWLNEIANEVHRESAYVEERWHKYATPVPRLFHKAEIKRSIKYNEDYNWDEKAARKYEKGLCQILRD